MDSEPPVKTVIQRRPILVFLGWTFILLVAPLVPRMLVDPAGELALSPDIAIAMVVVWGVGFVGAKTLQTLLAVLAGLGASILVMFEGIRAVGRTATGRDLLLYDALMLTRTTLGELATEWGSSGAAVALGGGLLLVALFYASGMALAARWLHEVRWQGPWRSMGLFAIVAAGMFYAFPDSRPVVPSLYDNALASLDEWNEMDEALDPETAFGPRDRVLAHPPEVRIAVVRGYTEALRLGPDKVEVGTLLRGVSARLAGAGWSVATGRTTPPGEGIRGLSEIAMLTAIPIPRSPHLAHVMFASGKLDTLPRFFERHGYRTAVLETADSQPSLRTFGFQSVLPPADDLPRTAGARLADAASRLAAMEWPSLVWVRPGHQLPEDPVEGLRAELEALMTPLADGPDHQVLWLWVGEPATGDDPDLAWPLVHVVASNPGLVDPWVDHADFRRGMKPGRTALPAEALGLRLAQHIQSGYACGRACADRRRAQTSP
ncbi:MAG: hypothetical protein AAF211_01095 [Myxococcota bacterium]